MTPHYVDEGGELNRLLDDLVGRVPQVTTAVMLTHDGGVPYPTGRPEGTAVDGRNAEMYRAPMEHPSMPLPLPLLTLRPRDVPSAGSVHSPHPMTAGQSDPAPYAE